MDRMLLEKGAEDRMIAPNARQLGILPDVSLSLQVFLYLQVLDLLTTLVGFKLGLSEASPFVRYLIGWGPAAGVLLSKIVAVTLAGICIAVRKTHIIGWINYWYAALVVWNLALILLAGNNG
ncbi:MAG: hypothetical protein HYZ57_20980 [Acidobacteria bacterium]|nr:hypothetical protein [Acidobacteriota bacterium]MBI3282300.1 hypothetical protein [Acidobacteriota bacterium]